MFKFKGLVAFSIIIVLVAMTGCATIMHGSKQKVSVTSDPSSAKIEIVTIGGLTVASGNSPLQASLSKKQEYKVVVSLEGYQTEEILLTQEFDMWVIGNIICGGIPGLIVDALSGAINQIEPDTVIVTLERTMGADNSQGVHLVMYMRGEGGNIYQYVRELTPMIGPLEAM
ncbi:PEGA domain-containing protein [bacterium]|nr:PEGA domain-containing protein [bacterium]